MARISVSHAAAGARHLRLALSTGRVCAAAETGGVGSWAVHSIVEGSEDWALSGTIPVDDILQLTRLTLL